MIRWLLCIILAFSLTVSQAQSPPSGTPGFSLQDLLGGLNLDEIVPNVPTPPASAKGVKQI